MLSHSSRRSSKRDGLQLLETLSPLAGVSAKTANLSAYGTRL